MIDFTDSQKKTIAAGITVLALSLVFAFTAFVLWVVFKVLSFASSAIIPVVLGFFLSLFFKPYYEWWQKQVRNPTLALAAMLLTIFVPLGFFLWYAGAVTIDQISNLIRQGPTMANHVVEWFKATFPKSVSLLDQLGVRYDSLGDFYTNYGGAALKAGSGALKFVGGILSALVTLIFFVFFLTSKPRRGSDIVSQLTFLKPETRDFAAEQIDAFVEILVSFFQRQTVICLVEGVYYGLGFALVGLPYGFLRFHARRPQPRSALRHGRVPSGRDAACLFWRGRVYDAACPRPRRVGDRPGPRRLPHHAEDPGQQDRARLRGRNLLVLLLGDRPRSRPRASPCDSALGVLRRAVACAKV